MIDMLLGAIGALSLVAGLIFLRYWFSTHDRFFLLLAASFWVEAGNRAHMAISQSFNETSAVHYMIRLVSYGLIVLAIWDKNRARR